MSYRYSARWASMGLGKALVRASQWQHAVPRVGGLFPGVSTPMPAANPALVLENICWNRAMQLWQGRQQLCVLWSGGVDSTLVASLLLETRPSGAELWVTTSASAEADGAEALARLVSRGASTIPLSELHTLRARGVLQVTAYHADSILIGEVYDAVGEAIWGMSPVETFSGYLGQPEAYCAGLLQELAPLLALMPVEPTAANVSWWVDFATFWDRDEYEASYRLGLGTPGVHYTSFFSSNEFQAWSQRDARLKTEGGYKAGYRAMVADILGPGLSFTKNWLSPEDELASPLFSPKLLAIREDYSLVLAS